MKATQTINVSLVNPRQQQSYCSVGGQKKFYTAWECPPIITRALGCAGGDYCTLDGARPVARCLVLENSNNGTPYSYLAAERIA